MFGPKTHCVVVVGAPWGDDGTGKIVDVLAERADLVVRYQGGANAGHTEDTGVGRGATRAPYSLNRASISSSVISANGESAVAALVPWRAAFSSIAWKIVPSSS